nr:uncharacterized protein LOC109154289 [Ipomoea batatas]
MDKIVEDPKKLGTGDPLPLPSQSIPTQSPIDRQPQIDDRRSPGRFGNFQGSLPVHATTIQPVDHGTNDTAVKKELVALVLARRGLRQKLETAFPAGLAVRRRNQKHHRPKAGYSFSLVVPDSSSSKLSPVLFTHPCNERYYKKQLEGVTKDTVRPFSADLRAAGRRTQPNRGQRWLLEELPRRVPKVENTETPLTHDNQDQGQKGGLDEGPSEDGHYPADSSLMENMQATGLFTPREAEAIAIREALTWTKSRGISNIQVESDALQIVHSLKHNVDDSSFDLVILDIKDMLRSLINVDISHVNHTANIVAHNLARKACSMSVRKEWHTISPSFIVNDLYYDLN